MKTLKTIPNFKSEAEEREFWLTHDSTDYLLGPPQNLFLFDYLLHSSLALNSWPTRKMCPISHS